MLDWTLVTRCCVGVRHAVREHPPEGSSRRGSHVGRIGDPPGNLPVDRLRYGVGTPVRAERSVGILPTRPHAILLTPLVVRALRR